MLEIPSLDDLRVQAEQDLTVEGGVIRQSLQRALAFALAGVVYLLLKTLQYLSRQLFPDTASEAFALSWADVYGVEQKPATQAAGSVQATGTAGNPIPAGEVLQRSDGRRYSVDAAAVVGVGGDVTFAVTAEEAGASGDAGDGTQLTFVTPPAGIDAQAFVVGVDGLSGGFDVETAALTKQRTLDLIRAPRRGGSEEDYEIWATEIAGISQAFARDAYAGIGTVLLIVAKQWDPTDPGDSPVPTAAQIAAVEAKIAVEKPAGLHLVSVVPPTLQSLDPHIVLDPDTTEVRDAVTRALALRLASVVPGTTAHYDDLVDAVNRAAGEVHHQLWIASGPLWGPYNVAVGADSLMVPGTITWAAPT